MFVYLLDRSLRVAIVHEPDPPDAPDSICISLNEDCPEDEKIFKYDETNIYVTVDEACAMAALLQRAIKAARGACEANSAPRESDA
jgi:hypothetical protein